MPDRAFFDSLSLSLSFLSFFFSSASFRARKKGGGRFYASPRTLTRSPFFCPRRYRDVSAHVFGHQSGDDFVHERDDGIGKVHLRERNGNGERGGDRRRGVAVATAETTNYCRFGAHEPRAKDNRVESKHGRERW